MPNWCKNTLTISGPNEDIKEFIENNHRTADKHGGDFYPLDLNKISPMPQTLSEDEETVWRKSAWGSLSNAKSFIHDEVSELSSLYELEIYWLIDNQEAVIKFDTLSFPPTVWLETIAEEYPSLYMMLEYREEVAGFEGIAEGKGLDIEDDSWNYLPPEDHSIL